MEKTKNILMFTGEVEGSKEKKRGGGGGRVEQIFFFFFFKSPSFSPVDLWSLAVAQVFDFKLLGSTE